MTPPLTDPCPGVALVITRELVSGVPGFYQHVHPVACDGCGYVGRARWYTDTRRHLCNTCMGKGL